MKKKILFLLFLLVTFFSYGQESNYQLNAKWFPRVSPQTAISEGSHYQIYLLTIAPGNALLELYVWWGHSAFVIEDLRTKNKDTRSMSFAAAISSFFGVSEPALYGVMIPRKMILVTGLAAAGVGGAIAGLGGAKLYTFGAHGLLGFPTFINPDGIDGGFIALCISGVVAFAIALVSALVIGDKQDSAALLAKKAEEKAPVKAKEVTIVSPVNGQAVDLTGVSDQVFSQLLLGDGIAVIPSDGKVYAPEDAIVRVAYPTGHAVGLAGTAGDELLIHIGVDTVNLNGQYFTSHVEQGMKVKKGDLLVEFDLDGIKKAGYDPTVMVVVTKTVQLDTVTPLTQGTVDTTTPLLSINLK